MNAEQKLQVLLVDDVPALLRLVSRWLEDAGYHVRCAANAQEAIAAMRQNYPDVLITDWEMPGLDGLGLLRWLREQSTPQYVYALLLTIRDEVRDVVQGMEAGADDFLKKPVDREELLARLVAAKRTIQRERELSRLSQCDSLTAFPHRRVFHTQMAVDFERARQNGTALSCVMLDIDYFKRINDLYGHMAGDDVLRFVAAMLRKHLRSGDLACRFGGEEFCVLLPGTSGAEAYQWANEVRRVLGDSPIAVTGGHAVAITASFGVAHLRDDTQSPDQLIDLADQALLVAKQLGRNRVVESQTHDHALAGQSESHTSAVFSSLTARQVMTSVLTGLKQRDTLASAAQFFSHFKESSAPVVDAEGKVVGILGEKELMAATLASGWQHHSIAEVVRGTAICFEEETPVLRIYEFMCRAGVQTVIIVVQGRPTGVISRSNLMRWMTNAILTEPDGPPRPLGSPPLLTDHISPRQRVGEVACLIADEAARLQDHLHLPEHEVIPCLVSGATRVQELAGELLAVSRCLDVPLNATPGMADMQRGATSVLMQLSATAIDAALAHDK